MFWDRLVQLCADRGISPSAAAFQIGLQRAAAAQWKKGSQPTDTTLYKLATFFDVPVSYFYEAGDTKKDQPVTGSDELAEALEAARNDERIRALFSEAVKATPEDIDVVTSWLRRLREKS